MSKLADDLEREFRSRTSILRRTLYLDPTTALELIRRANGLHVRILGIDGFVIHGGRIRPSMEHSVDYSHCEVGVAEAAIDFVMANQPYVTHFEVVLDSNS